MYSLKEIAERRQVAEAVVVPMLRGIRDRTAHSGYQRLNPDSHGRIYTLLQPDTASFRMSSSDSPLRKKHSTNLQNMAKKVAKLDPLYRVRDIFVADEGYELVSVDYVGAEAIGCAAYSQDWAYLDKLLAGADTHSELACFMFGVAQCTPLQRDIAKTIRYASQYAAKVPTITLNLNKEADTTGMYFSQEQVQEYHKKLLILHPLERWWNETSRQLAKNEGVLYNCFNYRRRFHDPDEHNRLKDGLSFYPQSTVACLMNAALPRIYDFLERIDQISARLLLQVHDEFLFQCDTRCTRDLIRCVTPYLTTRFTIHDHELYIPVEWKHGHSWGSMSTFKETV